MRSTDDQSTIRWLPVVGLYCFRGLKIDFNQNLSLCDRCTKSVRVHQLCSGSNGSIFQSSVSVTSPNLTWSTPLQPFSKPWKYEFSIISRVTFVSFENIHTKRCLRCNGSVAFKLVGEICVLATVCL